MIANLRKGDVLIMNYGNILTVVHKDENILSLKDLSSPDNDVFTFTSMAWNTLWNNRVKTVVRFTPPSGIPYNYFSTETKDNRFLVKRSLVVNANFQTFNEYISLGESKTEGLVYAVDSDGEFKSVSMNDVYWINN